MVDVCLGSAAHVREAENDFLFLAPPINVCNDVVSFDDELLCIARAGSELIESIDAANELPRLR